MDGSGHQDGRAGDAVGQEEAFDVVVLGGGAVGEVLAGRTAAAGLRTVLVEEELVGGDCSYWACMPSKALLRPGAVVAAARAVAGARQAVTGDLDVAAVLRRRDGFASDWDDSGQVAWLDGADVDLVRGTGRLVGARRVEVGTEAGVRVLTARHAVVVATGSEPVVPPVDGLATVNPWTSREVTSADGVPASLAVIGGGVVAVETATAYADLGASVTLLVRGDRLLTAFEPVAGSAVLEALRGRGVDVRLVTEARRARREPDGAVVLDLSDGSALRAAEVVVATGRRPRTADLGLDTVGLEPGEPLGVDDHLTVRAVPEGWLYAVGDVTGRTATTHQGKYDARVAGDIIARRARRRGQDDVQHDGRGDPGDAPWSRWVATADHTAVPQVVFGRPEVAAVGPTAEQARASGRDVRVVELPMTAAAGASLAADDHGGTATFVVDEARGVLVGATFVGPDVAELLHAATVAVVGEVPLARLWHAVPAYPTVSEIWLRMLEEYGL